VQDSKEESSDSIINFMSFVPNHSHYLLVYTIDGKIRIWNISQYQPVCVCELDLHADGKGLACLSSLDKIPLSQFDFLNSSSESSNTKFNNFKFINENENDSINKLYNNTCVYLGVLISTNDFFVFDGLFF
jgi:WD40 repeat protein